MDHREGHFVPQELKKNVVSIFSNRERQYIYSIEGMF
jgi:hypothetical protein